jgi:hypothetical protein
MLLWIIPGKNQKIASFASAYKRRGVHPVGAAAGCDLLIFVLRDF